MQQKAKMTSRNLWRHGFTLIELAIVLGIVGTVTAGLWRLSSNSNQQTKDSLTAQQHAALIAAVKGFLNDNTTTNGGQAWLNAAGASTTKNLPLPPSTGANTCTGTPTNYNIVFCNYLPPGFNNATTNSYGQTYTIQVKTGATPTQNYSFMIATSGGTIPDADGGRISSLIGSEGGFVYTSNVCGAPVATTACGTMGGWTQSTTAYGFATATISGEVASLSSPSSASVVNPQWLARAPIPGDGTYLYNTAVTNIFMNPYSSVTDGATPSAIPSIYLHTGTIYGDGPAGTTAQVALTAPIPTSLTVAPVPLIDTNSQCTVLNTGSFTAVADGVHAICGDAIYVEGDMEATGQIKGKKIFSVSDRRLKTNIHPITNGLETLMKIDPVSYVFKQGGGQGLGVIAQNVEQVYPELVSSGKDGMKAVEYNGLIGPLISAVQELKHQNEALRAQVEDQSRRLKDLEDKKIRP